MFRLRPFPLWLMTARRRSELLHAVEEAENARSKRVSRHEAVIGMQAELIRRARKERDLANARARESRELVAELEARLTHLGGRP